jgi:hypothetical protein
LRPKLERFQRQTDQILENIINEHKEEKYTKGKADQGGVEEDLLDVLLKYEDGSNLDFSLTKNNIKAIILVSILTSSKYFRKEKIAYYSKI